jgi:hypothetical protein
MALTYYYFILSPQVRNIFESRTADEGKFFHISLFRLKTNIMQTL